MDREAKIKEMISKMTLEEKVSQLVHRSAALGEAQCGILCVIGIAGDCESPLHKCALTSDILALYFFRYVRLEDIAFFNIVEVGKAYAAFVA